MTVYSSGNYKFGVKTTPLAKDQSPEARLQRFKQKCVQHVMISLTTEIAWHPLLCCRASVRLHLIGRCNG